MSGNRDKKGIYFIIAMIKNRPSQIGVIYELFDK